MKPVAATEFQSFPANVSKVSAGWTMHLALIHHLMGHLPTVGEEEQADEVGRKKGDKGGRKEGKNKKKWRQWRTQLKQRETEKNKRKKTKEKRKKERKDKKRKYISEPGRSWSLTSILSICFKPGLERQRLGNRSLQQVSKLSRGLVMMFPMKRFVRPFQTHPTPMNIPQNTSILHGTTTYATILLGNMSWFSMVFPSFSQTFPPPVFLHSLQLYHLGHSVGAAVRGSPSWIPSDLTSNGRMNSE